MNSSLSSGPRAFTAIARHRDASAIGILLLLIVVFALAAPGFTSSANLQSILSIVAVTACIAIGQNLIILAGEIDVSLGSVLVLSGYAAGFVAMGTGSIVLTLITALAVGTVAGVVNGLLVGLTPVPSIVVTLATLYVFQGLGLLLADSRNIVGLPAETRILGAGATLGIPHSVWTLVVAFIAVTLIRRHTRWGRDLLAIGDNRRASTTMGVHVRKGLIIAFAAAGTLAGLASVIYLGQLAGIQTSVVNSNLILQVIAAVAIGGTSIDGGKGTDAAPIIGALIIGVVTSGIVILGVPGDWIPLVYGVCLLVAVARDRLFRSGVRYGR